MTQNKESLTSYDKPLTSHDGVGSVVDLRYVNNAKKINQALDDAGEYTSGLILSKSTFSKAFFKKCRKFKGISLLDLEDAAASDFDVLDILNAIGGNIKVMLLNGLKITDTTIKHIAAFKHTQGIQELYLSGTGVTDKGMKYLQMLTNLQKLDISNTVVTHNSLRYIPAENLTDLHIGNMQSTDINLNHIIRFKNLQKLIAANIGIKGHALKSIYKLEKLTTLDIGYNNEIRDDDVKYISRIKKLEVLYLDGIPITNNAVQYLLKIKHLRSIFLFDTRITKEYITQLKNAFNDLRVAINH